MNKREEIRMQKEVAKRIELGNALCEIKSANFFKRLLWLFTGVK